MWRHRQALCPARRDKRGVHVAKLSVSVYDIERAMTILQFRQMLEFQISDFRFQIKNAAPGSGAASE
jgi:hypothetical protein